MSVQSRLPNITGFVQEPLENGQIGEKFPLLKPTVAIEDISYHKTESLITENHTSMPGSLPKSKKMISKGKQNSFKKDIQIMKLSQILEADLTSKDKVSEQYWSSSSEEISEMLSFHHQIGFQELEQVNSSNGSFSTSEEDLQSLTTNYIQVKNRSLPRNYLKLSQSSQPDTMGNVATQVTRKVRIYPNQIQKTLFNKCFNAHRYFYNKAIEQFNINYNNKLKADSFITVRNKVLINEADLSEENNNLWMKEIPYDTRQLAVKVAVSSRNAAISNLRNGNIDHFKMRFLSKKTSNNIFYINKRALVNGHLFKQKLYEMVDKFGKNGKKLKTKQKIDHSLLVSKKIKKSKAKELDDILQSSAGDFAIKQELDGKYYALIVVTPTDKVLERSNNICALDPGVRTFQTMYSENSIGEFGYDTSKVLYNIYRRIDKLTSVLNKNDITYPLNSKKRYKLNKRCALLRTKIKNIANDLHWKTSDYLTKNFDVILLPIFSSKKMANHNNRKIGKTTTRLLLGLSHYSFQQKLIYKANQRGKKVILCKEHYTTKCCGKCGALNENIGGKKIFHCKSCDLEMDRDIHAARNILLRGLTIYSDNLSG